MIPAKVREQYEVLMAAPKVLSRKECERRFPDLIAYIKYLDSVSIVDFLRAEGIELRPLSPDAPGIYVGVGGCPSCGTDILVKDKRP